MKQSTKRILVAGVILAGIAIVGAVAAYIAVNTTFSKVTNTIGESDFLKEKGEKIEIPVVADGAKTGESIQVDMNAETMKKIETKISVADKLAVLTLLVKALPSEEYSRIIKMAAGGITQEEFSQCYAVMKKHLSRDQKEQIKQYYAKYLPLLEK